MSIYILGPDSNGDCCACSERIDVCDTCTPAGGCECALQVPIGSLYSDYGTAKTLLELLALACRLWNTSDIISNYSTYSYTPRSNGFDIVANKTPQNIFRAIQTRLYVSISLEEGESVDMPYSITATGSSVSKDAIFGVQLMSCDTFAVLVDFNTGLAANSVSGTYSFTAPYTGTFILMMVCTVRSTDPFSPIDIGIDETVGANFSGVFVTNPIIALYDDSGTTRQLDACPKFLLPPRTENTGTWYSDETAAQSAITNLTDNCIGYINFAATSFVATGGSSLSLAFVAAAILTAYYGASRGVYGSINTLGGDTISTTINASVSVGSTATLGVTYYVFDDSAAIIFVDSSSGSSSATFNFAAPYSGKYIVLTVFSITQGATPFNLTASAVTTSSGGFSINPIQALYGTDPLLDCPARLDC